MNPFYDRAAGRAQHRCEYCRAPESIFNFAFEVEHLLPVSQGGSNALNNLALACSACNRYKSDFVTGLDPETQQEISLYHPRRNVWAEHFAVDVNSAEIVGLTPTGRATIARLQMNLPRQIQARQRWIRLAIFP